MLNVSTIHNPIYYASKITNLKHSQSKCVYHLKNPILHIQNDQVVALHAKCVYHLKNPILHIQNDQFVALIS